ncbi:MAG: LysR family transcriptional regulator [Pseudomonadota bacterium]|nr:LysR family transcriptional regulator [Pseudomonadota bacterium]
MTLVQLKHFIELAANGSFSKSADRLFLTQPALSRSIKSLEDELGQALFDRVGRKNELTPFGQHILWQARELVDAANNLKQSSQQLLSGHTGQVKLGLGSGPGALWMTPLLTYMAKECPGARLDIARGATTLLVQQLRERLLDALILDIRSLSPAPDLKVQPLCELPGAFMCSKKHPLAKRKSVTLAQIATYPVASTPLSDEVVRVLVERYGALAHPEQLVQLRCEEVSSLLDVARNTNTVVLAVRALAPDLVELPVLPALNANARFGWVSLKARTESPLAKLLQEAARDMAP